MFCLLLMIQLTSVSPVCTCLRGAASHLQSEAVGSVRGPSGEIRVAAGSGGSVQWLLVDHVGASAWTQSDGRAVSAARMASHINTHWYTHSGWGVLEVSHYVSVEFMCSRKWSPRLCRSLNWSIVCVFQKLLCKIHASLCVKRNTVQVDSTTNSSELVT